MVVAGRTLEDGDVAIMMVEAEATEKTIKLVKGGAEAPTEEIVAAGLDAAKPFIKVLCKAQADLAAKAAKPDRRVPGLPRLPGRRPRGAHRRRQAPSSPRRSPSPASRSARPSWTASRASPPRSCSREFEGREKEISAAYRSLTKTAGPRARHQGEDAHRRPRRHGHPYARRRGRGHPAGARLARCSSVARPRSWASPPSTCSAWSSSWTPSPR